MTNTAISVIITTIAFLIFWYPMGIHLLKMLIGYVKDEPVEYQIKCIVGDFGYEPVECQIKCIIGDFGYIGGIAETVCISAFYLLFTFITATSICLIIFLFLQSGLLIWFALILSIIAGAYGLLRIARFITRRCKNRQNGRIFN